MISRMHYTLKFIIATLLVTGVFGAVGFAQGEKDRPGNDPGSLRRIFRQLNFTPEQRQQVRTMLQQSRPALRKAQLRVRSARKAVEEAMYSEVLDESALNIAVSELTDAQSQVTKLRLRSELEIRKILTPEQLRTFVNVRREMRERGKQRLQNRRSRMDRRQRPRP